MSLTAPRLIISALRGGGGKTLLSLGLCRALLQQELKVKAYKKGPDYIDAHWLTLASQSPCTNLDPYFLNAEKLKELFVHSLAQNSYDIAIIEGNRGLFDGQDLQGSCATSELARILNAPVVLSLDITKMTRTSAALLQGMAHFEQDVHIAGVVLNQVGSTRHENIVRTAIEHYTDIPVLGAMPRLKNNPLPERHMGLNQCQESEKVLENLGNFITENCDLDRLITLAYSAPTLTECAPFWENTPLELTAQSPRIGYIYDDAFWFYYAENLEALQRAGAHLVPLSILDSAPWPKDLQGLYLGGGYPEEYATKISVSPHLNHIKNAADAGMPIYAECGGFMLLAQALERDHNRYAMANVFPVHTLFHSKPQGLGYVQAQVSKENPYHQQGLTFTGHEFHYSQCIAEQTTDLESKICLHLHKGTGMGKHKQKAFDGLCYKNTFAAYTHIFAPACPWWAENFVQLAKDFLERQ